MSFHICHFKKKPQMRSQVYVYVRDQEGHPSKNERESRCLSGPPPGRPGVQSGSPEAEVVGPHPPQASVGVDPEDCLPAGVEASVAPFQPVTTAPTGGKLQPVAAVRYVSQQAWRTYPCFTSTCVMRRSISDQANDQAEPSWNPGRVRPAQSLRLPAVWRSGGRP